MNTYLKYYLNQYSLYYNGSFTFSATYSSNVDFYTGNQYNICNGLNIVGGNNDRINGKIARVMLYGRGLSSSEILQNFNANRTRFGL